MLAGRLSEHFKVDGRPQGEKRRLPIHIIYKYPTTFRRPRCTDTICLFEIGLTSFAT